MLRATRSSGGIWHGTADVVRARLRRALAAPHALAGGGGLAFLLDLAEAPVLRDGDGLRLEDGGIVAVEAARRAAAGDRRARRAPAARLAWHLGNRHLPPRSAAGAS